MKKILTIVILATSFFNFSEYSYGKNKKTQSLTGQYAWGDYKTFKNANGLLSVEQVSKNQINFEIVAYNSNFNGGKAKGTVFINDGAGVFENPDYPKCKISFGFLGNKVIVAETAYGDDCGFGNNVAVEGSYTKIGNKFKHIEYP